jgi:Fur family transcriptional regulator, ferric uptake regulator
MRFIAFSKDFAACLFPRITGLCFPFYFHMRHSHTKATDPLREAGLKSTPGRRAVLQVLEKASAPLSPEQIHSKVGSEICDRATVYRILESLGEAGLVQRLILEGKTLYLPEESNHHHHHIVCRKCHSTVCLDECLISPLEKKAKQLGFHDIRHSLQLTGLCSKCAA